MKNDLDDLKRAMQSPPDYAPGELDLGDIMREGGRLRLRRRLAAGAAAAAAVVVLLVGGSQLIDAKAHTRPGTPTEQPAAAPGSPPAPAPSASPSATEPPKKPWGAVISTGLASKSGEWVFYGVAIDEAAIPDTHFGIMLGERLHNDVIVSSLLINEFNGSDRAPGFHQGEAPTAIAGGTTPAFGYFVGKPYRITAVVHGKTVTAGHHAWSKDPSVVVFWFDPAKVGAGTPITKLTAYDRLGKTVTLGGDSGFGAG